MWVYSSDEGIAIETIFEMKQSFLFIYFYFNNNIILAVEWMEIPWDIGIHKIFKSALKITKYKFAKCLRNIRREVGAFLIRRKYILNAVKLKTIH